MTDRPDFSDEELTAYLDGETEHAPADKIERARENDPALVKRLEHLSIDKDRMKAEFDALLGCAPDVPDLPDAASAGFGPAFASYRSLAATALVCLMVGAGSGYLLSPRAEGNWHDFVAAYQALYVNGTLSAIDRSEPAATAELARVSEAIGKKLELAAFTGNSQLDYKRAQVLGFKGQPLVQLAFLSKVGAPVALCIIRADGSGATDIRTGTMQGMRSAAWSKDGYQYLLIGGNDAGLIDQAARQFAARL